MNRETLPAVVHSEDASLSLPCHQIITAAKCLAPEPEDVYTHTHTHHSKNTTDPLLVARLPVCVCGEKYIQGQDIGVQH